MHDIEPHYNWRDSYIAAEDQRSPHFGRTYSEFAFSNTIYNYYIHPQWDSFGSATLYAKILFVDYDDQSCIVELIGEWNDCLHNDILFLKQNIIDSLLCNRITKFIVIMDNVLNFHGSDNCYYEEWFEEVVSENGWMVFLNAQPHISDEMVSAGIHDFVYFGEAFQLDTWRSLPPKMIVKLCEKLFQEKTFSLP